ncbi:MAG: HEAT repeat domain-containing protein [Deltaproteobacteria bacterium]|nr:HEAT repeat domain-containing protein [Deltaproteobacteria bacterium]
MVKNPTIKVRPWCPFCGQDVNEPREPVQRKMNEFKVGACQCGAVYTSDPTGFNVGSAMVECLVHACDDNWDFAWELTADDDYLTARIDNYDEQTHQVYETKNVDGRKVAGVLYFVRLTRDFAELSKKLKTHKQATDEKLHKPATKFVIPEMEPARDPKRKKKKANKADIEKMVFAGDIDALVDFSFDDPKTLRFMLRLLYDPREEKRWFCAHVIGQVCARIATRKPGTVSDLLHRMFESCTDSASTHWGLIEAIGSIIAARADIFGGFARHLLMYRGVPSSRVHVLWAMGAIAEKSPDVVRNTPIYSVFPYVNNPEPLTRGHAIRLLGRINALELKGEIEKQIDDPAPLIVYENGLPVPTTVGELARQALSVMTDQPE